MIKRNALRQYVLMLIVESADLPLRKNETNCHFLNTILLQPEKVVTNFFIFSQ